MVYNQNKHLIFFSAYNSSPSNIKFCFSFLWTSKMPNAFSESLISLTNGLFEITYFNLKLNVIIFSKSHINQWSNILL